MGRTVPLGPPSRLSLDPARPIGGGPPGDSPGCTEKGFGHVFVPQTKLAGIAVGHAKVEAQFAVLGVDNAKRQFAFYLARSGVICQRPDNFRAGCAYQME